MNKEKGENKRKNGINKGKKKERGGSEELKKKNTSTKIQNMWCCYLRTEYSLLNKLRAISQQTSLDITILEKQVNYLFRNFHPFIKFGFFFAVLDWEDLGVDWWIILGWISRRWDVGIWSGLG